MSPESSTENFPPEYIERVAKADELQSLYFKSEKIEKGDHLLITIISGHGSTQKVIRWTGNEDLFGAANPKWIPRYDQLRQILGEKYPIPFWGQGPKENVRAYDPFTTYDHEDLLDMVLERIKANPALP